MDKDTVYAAFMPFVVVVVAAAEFVLFAFFSMGGGGVLFMSRTLRPAMPITGYSPWYNFYG